MENITEINNQKITIKEFEKQRVVTFKDIDELHQRVEGTARRNFYENKEHFIQNVDYFEVSTKNVPTLEIYGFSKFAPSGIVITESGYLILAKSLTDHLAWRVQRELVNNYFRVKEEKPACLEDILIAQLQEMKNIKQQLNEVNHNALIAKEEAAATTEKTEVLVDRVNNLFDIDLSKPKTVIFNDYIRKYAITCKKSDFKEAWKDFDNAFLYTKGMKVKVRAKNAGLTRPKWLEANGYIDLAIRIADNLLNKSLNKG
jgi:hypothetical protein